MFNFMLNRERPLPRHQKLRQNLQGNFVLFFSPWLLGKDGNCSAASKFMCIQRKDSYCIINAQWFISDGPKTPIQFLTQSCDQISCYGKPLKQTKSHRSWNDFIGPIAVSRSNWLDLTTEPESGSRLSRRTRCKNSYTIRHFIGPLPWVSVATDRIVRQGLMVDRCRCRRETNLIKLQVKVPSSVDDTHHVKFEDELEKWSWISREAERSEDFLSVGKAMYCGLQLGLRSGGEKKMIGTRSQQRGP